MFGNSDKENTYGKGKKVTLKACMPGVVISGCLFGFSVLKNPYV